MSKWDSCGIPLGFRWDSGGISGCFRFELDVEQLGLFWGFRWDAWGILGGFQWDIDESQVGFRGVSDGIQIGFRRDSERDSGRSFTNPGFYLTLAAVISCLLGLGLARERVLLRASLPTWKRSQPEYQFPFGELVFGRVLRNPNQLCTHEKECEAGVVSSAVLLRVLSEVLFNSWCLQYLLIVTLGVVRWGYTCSRFTFCQ